MVHGGDYGRAFGNFIDRAFLGYVTDMVDTLFMTFAVYNFADICVVLGVIALAVYVIFFYEKYEGKKPRTPMPRLTLRADRERERADQLLSRQIEGLTCSAAQRLLEQGRVSCRGAVLKKNGRPEAGDELTVELPEPEPADVLPRTSPWTWSMRTRT